MAPMEKPNPAIYEPAVTSKPIFANVLVILAAIEPSVTAEAANAGAMTPNIIIPITAQQTVFSLLLFIFNSF